MDISKIISPQVETEVLKEQNEAQRQRIEQLEQQLKDFNPAAPFTQKIMDWLANGEGAIIAKDTKEYMEGLEEERERMAEKWKAKYIEMRAKHRPIVERFQKLTGSSFDLNALFGQLPDEDEE